MKFYVYLKNFDYNNILCPHGPLFHRWLPNGENDAISLDSGDDDAKLMVWFDRFGTVDGKQIRFDLGKREVDQKIMLTQAILEGGPLFGRVEIDNMSEEIVHCLKNDEIGSEVYEQFGKRVVKIIYPAVQNFLDNLRTRYGQYWIPNIEKWDSRKDSLGAHCRNLQIEWRNPLCSFFYSSSYLCYPLKGNITQKLQSQVDSPGVYPFDKPMFISL